jgi:hypothetical protein
MTEAQLFAAVTPDLKPGARPAVRARMACPGTRRIERVRLVTDPVTGRPTVAWCSSRSGAPLACDVKCLYAESARED